MDYYKVLGVSENSSHEEIKKSFRKLSLKHHPDRGGNEGEFKKINEAYQTLGDPQKNAVYKRQKQMRNRQRMPNGIPFGHSFFKRGMPPGMPPGMNNNGVFMQMGPNGPRVIFRQNNNVKKVITPLKIHVEITLQEAFNGSHYPVDINRTIIINNMKTRENEKIYVDIRKGVDNGEIYIIKDKGDVFNNNKGDVKVFITIKKHDFFIRDGMNLIINKQLSLKESFCGFSALIEHLNGQKLIVKGEEGVIIKHGMSKSISKMGMVRYPGEKREMTGNLIIVFGVTYPDKLPIKTINILKDLL